jgi:hypothetical protein
VSERFVVHELSGCLVQVSDTAYAHRVVAVYSPHPQCGPAETRQRGRAKARELNEWDAHADAPLDFPRLRYGSEALL